MTGYLEVTTIETVNTQGTHIDRKNCDARKLSVCVFLFPLNVAEQDQHSAKQVKLDQECSC